jgi:hypothetical protein
MARQCRAQFFPSLNLLRETESGYTRCTVGDVVDHAAAMSLLPIALEQGELSASPAVEDEHAHLAQPAKVAAASSQSTSGSILRTCEIRCLVAP